MREHKEGNSSCSTALIYRSPCVVPRSRYISWGCVCTCDRVILARACFSVVQGKGLKFGLGGLWFLVLLTALVGPLIIFSDLNPSLIPNAVSAISVDVCMCCMLCLCAAHAVCAMLYACYAMYATLCLLSVILLRLVP
jgi:hypothetical protein